MLLDWGEIDTIHLDMDGTLLDRRFDDHFWLEHVPRRYAEKHSVTVPQAKKYLYEAFGSQENTLNWTDLDYWSDRLSLDIPVLKKEVDHLIAVHPFVVEFLLFLRQHRKRIFLVTNAHSKTLDLKMAKTRLGPYFDRVISAHELGLPKEDPLFWSRLQKRVKFEPERTLLGEDSETNLGTAAAFGIRHLIYVSRYSSVIPPVPSTRYCSIRYFSELMPAPGAITVTLQPAS